MLLLADGGVGATIVCEQNTMRTPGWRSRLRRGQNEVAVAASWHPAAVAVADLRDHRLWYPLDRSINSQHTSKGGGRTRSRPTISERSCPGISRSLARRMTTRTLCLADLPKQRALPHVASESALRLFDGSSSRTRLHRPSRVCARRFSRFDHVAPCAHSHYSTRPVTHHTIRRK